MGNCQVLNIFRCVLSFIIITFTKTKKLRMTATNNVHFNRNSKVMTNQDKYDISC
jgi:hypothetical protein